MAYTTKKYILFGGDYNPNQWDEATLRQDMIYFREAKINTVVLPVFSWAKLEPSEGQYNFGWLDHILDVLEENGIGYILATPTGAQPAWMSRKYPEILPVDIEGRKRTHGMRVFFCYNSEKYRERAAAIAAAMAQRYRNRKGLEGWHVANEYGTSCYCENCQKKFRDWLKRRYGTIENLNARWGTEFWGRTYYSFEEVMLPTKLNDDCQFFPACELDYQRFKTDSTIACFENEAKILKAATPDLPVYTNISGYIKKLDQFKMVPCMDVAGWDNYPSPQDPRSLPALKLDIMRAARDGESFYVAEQSPAQQNWQPYNKLKTPGEMRRIAYQGLAHGGDSSLFFQMRQSRYGQEKMHGAIIGRAGTDTTRTFREAMQLGRELEQLGARFVGGRTKAKIGILFDWDNWNAMELCSGPSRDKDYLKEVLHLYEPFYYKNVPVDVLKYTSDFSEYRVILAPCLYMLKDNIAERLNRFVKEGGTLVTGYLSGYADENDRCEFGAYPGPLRKAAGIWVEETDGLFPDEKVSVCTSEGITVQADFLCDVIHTEGADPIAEYTSNFYAGTPAATCNHYGKGKTYYLATKFGRDFLDVLAERILRDAGLAPLFPTEGDVELSCREKEGICTYFAINFGRERACVDLADKSYTELLTGRELTGNTPIEPGDVLVFGRKSNSEGEEV